MRATAAALAALLALAAPAAAQDTQSSNATLARAVPGTHQCADYYPAQSQKLGEAGVVTIGYDVEEDGSIDHVHTVKSSGVARLDDAALKCVTESWRDTAATRGGVAVRSPDHVANIEFKLVEDQTPAAARPPVMPGSPIEHPLDSFSRSEGEIYAAVLLVLLAALGIGYLLLRRPRPAAPRSVTCPHCATVNVVPPGASRVPDKCSACGESLTVH